MSDRVVIKTCADCGAISDGREYCPDCEVTAVYVYSSGQMQAATPLAKSDDDKPEAA